MSKLQLFGRPWTVFDPANKEHRNYYHKFVHTGTWGGCPVRFVVPDDHGDLITMIQRSLIAFYVDKEFGETPNEIPQRIRPKYSKTVDNLPK
jgi:hypothetical protein